MANLAPMGAPRFLAFPVLALLAGSCVVARAQDQSPPPASSSTTQTIHEKTGPNSSRTIRRTTVLKEASSPELGQAEEAIQKQDYAAAEPLLQKLVDRDPSNYVAWFDLGFVQNALGLAGVTPEEQQIVTGAVLILTLIIFGSAAMLRRTKSGLLRLRTSGSH